MLAVKIYIRLTKNLLGGININVIFITCNAFMPLVAKLST